MMGRLINRFVMTVDGLGPIETRITEDPDPTYVNIDFVGLNDSLTIEEYQALWAGLKGRHVNGAVEFYFD